MNFDHIPDEYQHRQIAAEARRLDLAIRSSNPAEMKEAIQRMEEQDQENQEIILRYLIEHGAGQAQTNKAALMLNLARRVVPEEQEILGRDSRASSGRAAMVTLALEYFALHPQALLEEVSDPTPAPPLDPAAGFLKEMLQFNIKSHPSGQHSTMRHTPAPVAFAYCGVTNGWIIAGKAGEQERQYYLDAAASWCRAAERMSQ